MPREKIMIVDGFCSENLKNNFRGCQLKQKMPLFII
jgi:hypothetical protein